MTCIVGLVHGGEVFIGGDSAGVGGNYSLAVRADAKVFTTGPFVMGFTTSFRMGQLLRYALVVPEQTSKQSVDEFMVTTFVSAVRECLKSGGFAMRDKEQEQGGTFLVGYRGRLFNVEGDYQVGECALGFDAVGCAADVARGHLYATSAEPLPISRLRGALEAAESFSAGVRGPFVFVREGEA